MKKILLIIILFLAANVSASFITIRSEVQTELKDDQLIIDISTTNLGDEPAYNVQLNINVLGKNKASSVKQIVGIRESFPSEFLFNISLDKSGNYPIILTTHYQDANYYPFSSISPSFFVYQENVISDIIGMIKQTEISGKGILSVTLRNTGEKDKIISFRLITPKEIAANEKRTVIELESNKEKELNFEIESFSALPGSTYTIIGILEYDEDGKHYSSNINGVVKIVEKRSVFRNSELLIGALIVLIIIFVYFQFKKKK